MKVVSLGVPLVASWLHDTFVQNGFSSGCVTAVLRGLVPAQ